MHARFRVHNTCNCKCISINVFFISLSPNCIDTVRQQYQYVWVLKGAMHIDSNIWYSAGTRENTIFWHSGTRPQDCGIIMAAAVGRSAERRILAIVRCRGQPARDGGLGAVEKLAATRAMRVAVAVARDVVVDRHARVVLVDGQ